ncbi:MAG: gamma-butyrobetaine,2-oxoglutarate dioxygenase [Candidatus Pelagibacter sp. TMED118]|nr:MAG: gamma-butyrobetaine,2-oxoglutarate dioxygenase [Candidatus Pelagibacter sp. TMED118]|tara:strand:- start:3075 stop:4178 length:1104 start_codon:yes stop_codon:yes gene_type:complete
MKIELNDNKVLFNNGYSSHEIHPFWLRERASNDKYFDTNTQQRKFDPTILETNITIKSAKINNDLLEINFTDGVNFKLEIDKIIQEFSKEDLLIGSIKKFKWDSSFGNIDKFNYSEDIFESKEMYELLIKFYKYGFVIFKNVPVENNFIVSFANSIGSIRRTNFGEYFNVKSIPNPNDLAYTSLPLAPHTDNPYRNPVPCIQLLHCIANEVSGGYSTLVDGYTVTEDLKKEFQEFYNILTEVKVKFKFIDKDVVLEGWSELIKLDENNEFKQVKFSPRLDFVPILKKDKLDLYYKARNKISSMYNSDKYRIEFKLMSGDLLMMDNYRLLHGRTEFDANEGLRFLQGAYIDFDSTEGKLRHLKRKFNF